MERQLGWGLALLPLFGLMLPTTQAQQKAPRTFYIAPNGSDRHPGTREKPFATLEQARNAIRGLRKEQQPITVVLRGGTYRLDAPLVLGPEDSGTADAPVVFAAEPGEQPVLSGGRRITGWKEKKIDGKMLWTAELPEVKAGKWYFHQLWVNGQRRQRARHPNDGFLRIAGLPDADKNTPWNQGQNRFQFAPGAIKAWSNLEDVDVVALHLWVSVRLPIADLDEQERLVTFAAKSRRRLTEGDQPARYYVENALELLDAPGEWYLQRKSGTLYYWPMPGENLAKAEVIAPALSHLVRFEGKPEAKRPVAYVTFRGLTFAHAEWWPQRNDPVDIQAAAPVPGALQGEGMDHCALEGCRVAHVGNYAIHFGRDCRHNRITGCELFDLGAGGIKIGEGTPRDDASQQTHENVIADNHIHDGGRVFHQGVGVWIGQSYGNRVAHNHIHDLYYTGISCGWTWGYGKSLARDNVIEFNDVHDLGKDWLSDLGGIYTLGVQPGTVIRGNRFHTIAGYRYGGWGIYFDEGSTNIVAENNLVYGTTHGGFHQHYGKDNIVRNNIFAFGRDAQIQRSRPEDHRSFTFERNIVTWKEGKLLAGNWKTLNVAFNRNLYWREGGGEVRFGNDSWEQWRGKGMDLHSVLADPLFVKSEQGDFRLRKDSPALALGFVPLELSSVGPRPEAKAPSEARQQPLRQAHAHNDYEHKRPLLDALEQGFCSVEADVYLVDDELLVGHTRLDLRPERTLEKLYLAPLKERVRANGGRVYRDGPTFYLLIDVKTEARPTYAAVDKLLAKYSDMLSVTRDGKHQAGAVTVVISGNRDPETMHHQKVRYAGIDGRPSDLDSDEPASQMPWISASWGSLFRWTGEGPMPEPERRKLRDFVARAHQHGRMVRFWATPEKPEVWKELLAAKVDLINTDRLAELRQFLLEHAKATDK